MTEVIYQRFGWVVPGAVSLPTGVVLELQRRWLHRCGDYRKRANWNRYRRTRTDLERLRRRRARAERRM